MTTEPRPNPETIPPVRKELTLRCSADHAFTVFTRELGTWWPLASHSISGDRARTASFEPRVGGRLFETDADGAEHPWGEVTEWAPPNRVAFRWHPGGDPARPTRVDVRFEAIAADQTRMVLVHSGWDVLDDGAKTRAGYESGWDGVLERYRGATV